MAYDRVKQVVHVYPRPHIWQLIRKPDHALCHIREIKVVVLPPYLWRIAVLEEEREGVPLITQCIALKPISFPLVTNLQLHPGPSLEPDGLLINSNPFPWDPMQVGVVVELIDEALHLSHGIFLLLICYCWIQAIVRQGEKST